MKQFAAVFFVFGICLLPFKLDAQDLHFTQFYAAPLTFNPALSGGFNGTYRLGIIYRDQWRQALEDPIVSFAGSVDLRFRLSSRRRQLSDAVGAGVLFYSDRFGPTGFSTNQISISGAYHKSLSKNATSFLSLGFQAGIAQRNVNYDNINFDDQFNGTDGFSDPTAEVLPENNFSFGDYAVGLNYSYAPYRQTAVFAGVALHHFLQPNISFYQEEDGEDMFPDNQLLMKLTAHLTFQIPLSETIQLLPRGLFYAQGTHMALNAGTNVRFLVNDIKGTALHIGASVRPVRNDDNFGLESVIGMAGIEFNNFLFGFSYDANVMDFSAGANRRSAFEISIAYLGNYDNDLVICPKF